MKRSFVSGISRWPSRCWFFSHYSFGPTTIRPPLHLLSMLPRISRTHSPGRLHRSLVVTFKIMLLRISNPDDFARGDTAITDGMIYAAGTIAKGKTTIDPKGTPIVGRYHWIGTWAVSLKDFQDAVAEIRRAAPPILAFATEQFDLPG